MTARLARILALLLVATTVALASPAQAQKIRSDFFGMHDSQIAYQGTVPGVATGAIRLWDSGTSWREIETSPGAYNWGQVDRAVAAAEANGLRPLLVLGQTPQFHATDPTASGAFGPGATSMPNLDAWTSYVTAAAERYGTRVDYQVWNEPNVVNYWTGTVQQMATLTSSANKAITQTAGKKATVVAPAFPLRLGSQQKWFKAYWKSKVGGKSIAGSVDVVAVNLYPAANQGPEASMPLLAAAKRALPTAARKKPLWNTEINYGLLGGDTAKTISETKQAQYVGRTLLLNAGSTIKRMYWYSWDIGPIANTHLVEDDRTTLTRAGRTWGEVRGWLVGTDVSACKKLGKGKLAGTWTCTARGGRTDVRRFYWKPTGKAVTITTVKSTTSWTDLTGDTTKKKGRYKLKVSASPIMVRSRS